MFQFAGYLRGFATTRLRLRFRLANRKRNRNRCVEKAFLQFFTVTFTNTRFNKNRIHKDSPSP